ncbi:SpoIIE family protein phosphatase [Oligoflexia bacterium]|nr:SpoIIE family protein phosphatase [Oligoflexia bacterium]
MDSILILGVEDSKLIGFFKKMGYALVESSNTSEIPKIVGTNLIDLILIDTRLDIDGIELCQFLRSEELTKTVPIIFISDDPKQMAELKEQQLKTIEYVTAPYSVGRLVSVVATQLRLRKFAGADEMAASIGEMNAALRDLNEKFKHELEEARKIQQILLPEKLPSDDRFELAVSYEPLEEVGGDWFYAEMKESGNMAVQIADVTGHGLQAAFIGSMTKLAMVAAETEQPHELLREMNRLMAPQCPDGKFVTMFSYLYNPANGQLDYARAGHLPGFLLKRSQNEVVHLMGDGFAVGFFEDSEFTPETAIMDVDDILVIMTDGIPEGQNMARENYGYDHFSNMMVNSKPSYTAAEILATIIGDFEKFRGERILKDDVTVITLKRLK